MKDILIVLNLQNNVLRDFLIKLEYNNKPHRMDLWNHLNVVTSNIIALCTTLFVIFSNLFDSIIWIFLSSFNDLMFGDLYNCLLFIKINNKLDKTFFLVSKINIFRNLSLDKTNLCDVAYLVLSAPTTSVSSCLSTE